MVKILNDEYYGTIIFLDDIKMQLLVSEWFINNDIILGYNKKKIYTRKGEEKNAGNIDEIPNISIGCFNKQVIFEGLSSQIIQIKIGDIVESINGVDVINFKSNCELRDFTKNELFD